jgi:hypothetical protein
MLYLRLRYSPLALAICLYVRLFAVFFLAATGIPPHALEMPLSAVKLLSVERIDDISFLYVLPNNFVGTVEVAALPSAVYGRELEILAGMVGFDT